MLKMKYFVTCCLLILTACKVQAQIGGNYIYQFLNLPASARITALGGNLITVKDDDVALAIANPAALNSKMHNQISFSQDFHPSGINFGSLNYARHFKNWHGTTIQGGVQYISYGTMQQTTPEGNVLGDFKASEYLINLGVARSFSEYLSLGVNWKTIMSYLGGYSSYGMAFDLAAMYSDTASRVNVTLLMKNMGFQMTQYSPTSGREILPFEIQLGFSQRMKHAPFRYSIIAHQLQRWNVRYDDPALRDARNIFGETQEPSNSKFKDGVDNFFRHLIFNVEALLGKREVLRLRIGYNYMHAREMRISNLRGLAGFTFGFGVKVSRLRIDYGFGAYHFAGSAHHFTLSTNLNEWIKK